MGRWCHLPGGSLLWACQQLCICIHGEQLRQHQLCQQGGLPGGLPCLVCRSGSGGIGGGIGKRLAAGPQQELYDAAAEPTAILGCRSAGEEYPGDIN